MTKIVVKGKGESLDMMGRVPQNWDSPSLCRRVCRQASSGECWEAAFDAGHVKKNEPEKFKAVMK